MLWVFLCPEIVLAAAAASPPPISSPNLLVVPATSAPPPSGGNLSSGNRLQLVCDSAKYGRNLKVPSCRNLFQYLNKDDAQITFAERDSGVPYNIPLPLRTYSGEREPFPQTLLTSRGVAAAPNWLACKYPRSHSDASTMTDDGVCFVQEILRQGAISGRASATEIGQAAFTLLQACVVERGMGGIAHNIGELSRNSGSPERLALLMGFLSLEKRNPF